MSHPSLAVRAFLSVIFFIGFYVLALGIATLLLYIPYLELTASNRIHLKLMLFCVIGAGVIIWSVLPRFDKFEAPGPEINLMVNPEFLAVIKNIANRSNQAMPDQIYLIAQLNAWVASRGGFMGIGSRRVMAIGLPLLSELTVDQFKAVLAHEFGHYYGGDVKLGPWIYKTRTAIGRTINNLAHHSSFLQRPFLWYGNTFLRITHGISRQQEFAADAFAARLIGKKPAIDGLTRIHSIGPAFEWFMQNEMNPLLRKGYFASIYTGFKQFLQSPEVIKNIESVMQKQLSESKTDIYDTHPSLSERLSSLQQYPQTIDSADRKPASTLFRQKLENLETIFLSWINFSKSTKLKLIEWNEVATKIYPDYWAERAKECKDKFIKGTKAIDFPLLINNRELFPILDDQSVPDGVTANQTRFFLMNSQLSPLLAHAMVQNGWEPKTSPGKSVVLFKNDKSFAAFDLTSKLIQQEISEDNWRQACTVAGIEDLSIT